jgi:D-arabinose 1-dehydrogenase-like Zn-dependent alcohol dehydrogenase
VAFVKAARLHKIGEDLKLDEVEVPSLADDQVLLKVRASGICHSDINYRDGVGKVARLPITLGHEISGIVAERGSRVEQVARGERVCVHYVVGCGMCKFCLAGLETYCRKYQMVGKDLDGGFAEYLKVPAGNVLALPETVPFEHGAILGCAVSTAYHALRRGRVKPTENVVVYGVGGLGIQAVQLAASHFKAGSVIAIDIVDHKLSLAKKLGAKEAINASKTDPPESIRAMTDGQGADVVLDFVGTKNTLETAISCAGMGARIVVIGISSEELRISPYSTIIGKETELVGSNDHLKTELAELIQLVASKRIDLSGSITHKVKLEEVNKGIQILEKGIGNPVRVVVEQ